MRLLLFCLLLVTAGCNSPKKLSMKSNELNGTWIPVRQEFAGTPLPQAAFATQKLIINNDAYTVIAESVDKGEVKFGEGKMDIYGKEGVNAGKHFTAIYKYENGELTVCCNLAGDSYPEAFDTKNKPLFFLSTFRKE